jgi:polyhydroxyalkanoate synthesis regulator phasin
MIDLIKKTLLASVGAAVVTKEKLEKTIDEYVREGKLSAGDAKIMAEKIVEQGRREFDEACAKLGSKLRDVTARADEATIAKLAALEKRVRVLEEKLTPPETRAGEP